MVLRIIFVVFIFTDFCIAENISFYENQSKIVIKELGKSLKTTLKSIIKESGPVAAIEYCNIAALDLTKDISDRRKLILKRTSLKYRNVNNVPDKWELSVLKSFEMRKDNGESLNSINESKIVSEGENTYFRFMQVIPVGKPCITCHGSNIKPDIAAKIDELYPNDMARGFKLGDIRGAFSVKVLLNN